MPKVSVIVDADHIGPFFRAPGDRFGILHGRVLVQGSLKLAFGGTQMIKEYDAMMPLIRELERAGSLEKGQKDQVDRESSRLLNRGLVVSNDPHIVALARCTRGRILVTGDQDLMEDFNNRELVDNPRAFIYRRDTQFSDMRKRFGIRP